MTVSTLGKFGVYCPQVSLNRHVCRGIIVDEPKICL